MQMWVWVDVFVHGFCGCYCVYAFFSLIYKLFLKKYKFTIHFYIFYTVIVNFCFVNLRRLHDYTIFKVNVWSIYKLILIWFFFSEKQANEGSSTGILLPIALVVLGVTVFIVCLYIWRRRKKMFCMKKGILSFIAQNCMYIIMSCTCKLNVSLFFNW